MIPNAFYDVKYSYDRGAKRWMVTFTSRELDNVVMTVPLLDDVVRFEGDDVICEDEEALGLAFLQYTEQVALVRARQEAGEQAKASAESEGPLDVPAAE